jgi:hypothetical protein
MLRELIEGNVAFYNGKLRERRLLRVVRKMAKINYLNALVEKLDGIRGDDAECAHAEADDILLAALKLLDGQEIIDAYERLNKRCKGFWYA